MKLLQIVVLMLLSTNLQAQSYDISRVVLWGGAGLDHASTEILMHRYPASRELNPLAGQNIYRRTAVGIGAAAGTDLATSWLQRNGHPKWAKFLNIVMGGFRASAGVHNLLQLRD